MVLEPSNASLDSPLKNTPSVITLTLRADLSASSGGYSAKKLVEAMKIEKTNKLMGLNIF